MKFPRSALLIGFFAFVLVLLAGHTVSANASHDENKFVYGGQALADYGQLPYRDYAYDQMPYAPLFYGLSAAAGPYDFLNARLLGIAVWLGSMVVLAAIVRLMFAGTAEADDQQTRGITWLTALGGVVILLLHPGSSYVLESAKNNSFATLFALLAFLFFVRGVQGRTRPATAASWSSFFASVAGCTRLNYFSVSLALVVLWLVFAFTARDRAWLKLLGWFAAGGVGGALPALVLLAAAPRPFYYANLVQLRLTTLYYETMLSHQNMDLPTKLGTFFSTFREHPINIALYAVTIAAAVFFAWRVLRERSGPALVAAGAAACAGVLLLTAFMATPMMDHYLFAPLPFMLIVAAAAVAALWQWNRKASLALEALLLASLLVSSSAPEFLGELDNLAHPSAWVPLQVHAMAERLTSDQRVPPGKVLSLVPMYAAEGGYEAYGFTASGSNSWRTSLLLTADRRRLYGVTSPEELAALLDADPPSAIITGFETYNPGFTFRDMGGLEKPFVAYAQQHGYTPINLSLPFVYGQVVVWRRP